MHQQWRAPAHRSHRRAAVVVVVAALGLTTSCARAPGLWVYETDAAAAQQAGSQTFDAQAWVEEHWSADVLPAVEAGAVDAPALLAAVAADPQAAGARYGRQNGAGSPYAVLVKGTGTASAVDTALPSGPVTVDVTTPDGPQQLLLVTGPVIAGSALRDAVGVSFNDFTNQLDYADVATQLNARVKSDVVAGVDLTAVEGRQVTFEGAASLLPGAPLSVVPTSLQVGP